MNDLLDNRVIIVNDLTKYFGEFLAVDHISFTVEAGEVIGYLGPNGSGKTTTIRMLLGLLMPSDGKAVVLGYDAFRQSEFVRERVGYMSQKFSLYHDLTIRENLEFYAGIYGIKDQSRLDNVLSLVDLSKKENLLVSELPTGWRQRLALATAIVHEPRLLFLDEPTSGVDPESRRTFWDLIYELVENGVTVLVTTHYMDEAEYCGKVGIMRSGQLLAMDTPLTLKETALPGLAWDVFIDSNYDCVYPSKRIPILFLLDLIQDCPFVIRTGLVSDRLRAITSKEITEEIFQTYFKTNGIHDIHLVEIEPTLEDVFLALAHI